MRYAHIIRYINSTPFALTDEKVEEIKSLLSQRLNGIRATPEELVAFAGPPSPAQSQRGAVAVLSLRGVIAHRAGALDDSSGGVSTEAFARLYRQVMQDASIASVVIDCDSPGGAVAGVHELAQEMLALRGTKKVIAVANSLMASAALWLMAAAADEIVAIQSAMIGSIGVASIYIDDSKQREADGITVEVFTSAENKLDSLGLGPLSEDAKARRKARVMEAGSWFRSDVARGRGVSVADVRSKFGEGAVFSAKEALAVGLIDRIGSLDETIGRLAGRKAGPNGLRAELDGDELAADAVTDKLLAASDRARRRRLL